MSRTWNYLHTDEELAASLMRLGDMDAPLSGCMRAIYFRHVSGDWKFVTGNCVFEAGTGDECAEIYRQHAYVQKKLSKTTVREFLEKLKGDGIEMPSDFPAIRKTAPNTNWKEELIPSHARSGGLPGKRLVVTLESNANFADGQLVDYKLPYRPSAARYASAFLELQMPHDSADGRKGEFFVELTDSRGAIRIEEGRLSIAHRTQDLRLVGVLNGKNVDLRNNDATDVEGKAIHDAELWLLAQDHSVVDCLSTTEWPYRFDAKPEDSAHERELLEMVLNGESEICEFKPYVDINNAKATEIEKTVCAFSNQRGGVLFIGVTKEGEVVGLAKDIWKRGDDLSKVAAKYEKEVRSRLRESLKDNQCFKSKVVSLLGTLVIVIEVVAARDTNYLVKSEQMNTAYIRHGATSMKMSPPEMKAKIESARSFTEKLF